MAFDSSKPADNQKIRLGPTDIRDNFSAIESGDSTFNPAWINLIDSGTVANQASMGRVYGDIDNGSNIELHYVNDNGDRVQLTQDGKLGSEGTDIYANSISLDGGATSFDKDQTITAWGYFNSSGVFQFGKNMENATPGATGFYTVSTTAIMSDANVGVFGIVADTADALGRNLYVQSVPSLAASKVSFTIKIVNSSNGAALNRNFYIMIVGGL